jgi:hypothetical protein
VAGQGEGRNRERDFLERRIAGENHLEIGEADLFDPAELRGLLIGGEKFGRIAHISSGSLK